METNHTPAPWKIRGDRVGKVIESDDQDDGMMLSIAHIDMYDTQEQAIANRLLICAAPALLDALESARSFIFRHAQTDCNTGELICKKTEAELIKIDAAIAAARGTA